MGECFFWYRLTLVVPDKIQRAIKWFVYVCVCGLFTGMCWLRAEWHGSVLSLRVELCRCKRLYDAFLSHHATLAVLRHGTKVADKCLLHVAIVDSSHHPQCANHNMYLLMFVVELNCVGIDALAFAVMLST